MKKKGFTLIELIIVLAILALLVAIAVPKYNASQKKAAVTAHQANLASLETAAQLFWSDEQRGTVWTPTSGEEEWSQYLTRFPEVPKQLSTEEGQYTVSVDEEGDVRITPGEVEMP